MSETSAAIPSIDGFLGYIVTIGIVVIFLTVWRVSVRIERRIGRLDGDRKVLEERTDGIRENINRMDSRLTYIERLAWEAAPSRAKLIRETRVLPSKVSP
jgi:hypothetical protein